MKRITMKTMKELAEVALAVQDASNLSGVVHMFSAAITDLRANLRAEGKEDTDTINSHPVCILFSSKIASLTQSEDSGTCGSAFGDAYDWAMNQVTS